MIFTKNLMQIYKFDAGLSIAYDKNWHDGHLYKLKRMEICGDYFGK